MTTENDPRSRGQPGTQRLKSFAELGQAMGRDREDASRFSLSSLQFGAVFWIPDEISGFGRDGEHPWVIVGPYRAGSVVVAACPRTSQVERNADKGLLLPAGVVHGLDRDGVILLAIRRSFIAAGFSDYRYAGDLPREWQHQLRAELDAQAWRIGRASEEP